MVRYHEITNENTMSKEEKIRLKIAFYDCFTIPHTNNIIVKPDGSIDVFGDCRIRTDVAENLTEFPVKFNEIEGAFNCSETPNLKSLKNGPIKVGKLFCRYSGIISLEGCPINITEGGAYFDCCENLSSLEGLPISVRGDLEFTGCNSLKLNLDDKLNCDVGGFIFIPYRTDLPMLRILREDYQNSTMQVEGKTEEVLEVMKIINHFIDNEPNTKKRILDCQYALIKAGFKGNAKW
jgi:hypothetical protein